MRRRHSVLSDISGNPGNKDLTDFQRKVYRAVSQIPAGEVRTYRWVAARAGSPGAYRAVGNALHRNPHPVIVPCHRVVRSDGSLGGYSGGAAAKRSLLKSEGIDCPGGRCYNHT